MTTFIDDVLAGRAVPEDIDDYVELWHSGFLPPMPLYKFLGLTPHQYGQWLVDPAVLGDILAEAKATAGRPGNP
jgi:hypothetical protein